MHIAGPGAGCGIGAGTVGPRGGALSGTDSNASGKGCGTCGENDNAGGLGGLLGMVNSVALNTQEPFVTRPLSDLVLGERVDAMVIKDRLCTPREIAEAIAWLLSSQASYCAGITLMADSGMVMR
jgi:hypothetical protein